MKYLPGLASNLDPLISASRVARITCVSHQHPALCFIIDLVKNIVCVSIGESKRGFFLPYSFSLFLSLPLAKESPKPKFTFTFKIFHKMQFFSLSSEACIYLVVQ
jgi:hypothetical protein